MPLVSAVQKIQSIFRGKHSRLSLLEPPPDLAGGAFAGGETQPLALRSGTLSGGA